MKRLLESLRQAGQSPILLAGSVVILPFGGRVIGVFPDGLYNVLWVNDALRSADSAKALFANEGWANVGGDRTWISPEIDTNVGDPKHWEETYDVPKAIDPAQYRVLAVEEDSATITTSMDVLFRRSETVVALELIKTVTAVNPAVELPTGVSAAGYSLKSIIRTPEPLPKGIAPGIWNILQVPPGGRIVIPLADGAEPRPLTGKPEFEKLGRTVQCTVSTEASFKFGIHASDSHGVALYARDRGDYASMIVRKFQVNPDALYADVPFDSPKETGYMQQVYVDDGALGGFGEIEYHAPAIHGDATEVTDVSEVWAFIGPQDRVTRLQEQLVSQS